MGHPERRTEHLGQVPQRSDPAAPNRKIPGEVDPAGGHRDLRKLLVVAKVLEPERC